MGDENGYTSGISATLKAAEGFDAPWVVIHAKDAAEMAQHLTDLYEGPVLNMVAQLQQIFQGKFEQKPRYQQKSGSGNWNGGRGRPSSPPAQQPAPSNVPSPADPPPAFVQNQQAQPANWGQQPPPQQGGWNGAPNPQAVQQLQQNLGAQVMGQVPNEVAYCADHGNAPRQYYGPGTNSNNVSYSASYRCQVKGCGAWWQNDDGTWKRSRSK